MTLSIRGRWAVRYAERFRWAVLPVCYTDAAGQCSCGSSVCHSPGKHPLTAHGVKDASKDAAVIAEWWTRNPYSNVAVAAGTISGFTVLDVDLKGDGPSTLTRLVAEHGGQFPATMQQKTWSGGGQFFFKHQPGIGNKVKFAPGLDTRNDGGYTLIPPSTNASATHIGKYEWIVAPWDIDILPEMPTWFVEIIMAGSVPIENGTANPPGWADELMYAGVAHGARDNEAHRLIQHARETGMPEARCWERLTIFGSRCTPSFDPFTDQNIKGKIVKAYRRARAFEDTPPVRLGGKLVVPPLRLGGQDASSR